MEIIKPLNIAKKVAYLVQSHLNSLQSFPLGIILLSHHLHFSSLQSSLLNSPSADSFNSPEDLNGNCRFEKNTEVTFC